MTEAEMRSRVGQLEAAARRFDPGCFVVLRVFSDRFGLAIHWMEATSAEFAGHTAGEALDRAESKIGELFAVAAYVRSEENRHQQ